MTKSNIENIIIFNFNLATHYKKQITGHVGVCIFIKNNLKAKDCLIHKYSMEIHTEFAALKLESHKITITVCYRSPLGDFNIFVNCLSEILDKLSVNKNVILVGDFNIDFNSNCQKVSHSNYKIVRN